MPDLDGCNAHQQINWSWPGHHSSIQDSNSNSQQNSKLNSNPTLFPTLALHAAGLIKQNGLSKEKHAKARMADMQRRLWPTCSGRLEDSKRIIVLVLWRFLLYFARSVPERKSWVDEFESKVILVAAALHMYYLFSFLTLLYKRGHTEEVDRGE